MPSILLKVEQLTISTPGKSIVSNFSFEIYKGEIVVLTGNSGSGKTSLGLAIINHLPNGLLFQAGRMLWSNGSKSLTFPEDVAAWNQLRGRNISFIQQDVFGGFDPVMRMGDQMTMVVQELRGGDLSTIQQSLRSSLIEVGVGEADRVLKSYPHQLSGGQLQRCRICMAILIKPDLIIADEPTSAIDKINQLEILDLFRQIRQNYGIAILCISHEKAVVKYLADREISLELHTEFKAKTMNIRPTGSMAGEVILSAEKLGYKHHFGGFIEKKGAIIENISFSITSGQCLAVIGQSGSGKSTLAQMLVGLLKPLEGSLSLEQKMIDFESKKDILFLRSRIQLVMQDGRGSLNPHKTIRWILHEVAMHAGGDRKNKLIDLTDVLREVGLSDQILDRKENSLSGGECLRVCIARALLVQPAILICDESTTALDEDAKQGIIQLLQKLMSDQNLTVILIAHDESLTRQLATQILVMDDGKIAEIGEAFDVMNHPSHAATKRILSANATLFKKEHL